MNLNFEYKQVKSTATDDKPLQYDLILTGVGNLDEINNISKILSGEKTRKLEAQVLELKTQLLAITALKKDMVSA
jgi:hypothetical protein